MTPRELFDEMNRLVPELEEGMPMPDALVLILRELKRLKALSGEQL